MDDGRDMTVQRGGAFRAGVISAVLVVAAAVLALDSWARVTKKGHPFVYEVLDLEAFSLVRDSDRVPKLSVNFLRTWDHGSNPFWVTESGVFVFRPLLWNQPVPPELNVQYAGRWRQSVGDRPPGPDMGAEIRPGVFQDLAFGPPRVLVTPTLLHWLAFGCVAGAVIPWIRFARARRRN